MSTMALTPNLADALERGEYVVDPLAVAQAILDAGGLDAVGEPGSAVLVALEDDRPPESVEQPDPGPRLDAA